MRPRSLKRQKSDRAAKQTLADFAEEFPFCWCCGGRYGVQTHHIAHRHGHAEMNERGNLARLCGGPGTKDCHGAIHNGEIENPKLYCLALKHIHDREGYNRLLVLRVWGKAETCIEETEVLWEVADILEMRKKLNQG